MPDPATLDALLAAVSGEESGGSYGVTNKDSGAHGKYQIMPGNWPSWAVEAGLSATAPQTPANQETVARFKLSQYLDEFGSPQAAAVAWYGGEAAARKWMNNPEAPEFTRKQGDKGQYPSINDYAHTVGYKAASAGGSMGDKTPLQVMTEAGLTPQQIRALDPNRDALATATGWAAHLADIPELKSILDQAVAEKWTPDEMTAAINNSAWAQSKNQAQVNYEVNRRLHPGDVASQRHTLELQIQDTATKMGMTLTPDRLQTMSGWALKKGYTPDEIDQMVKSEFHYDPAGGLAQGQAATNLDALKKEAGAYMVPVSDGALGMWVNAIAKGQQDPASFTEWVRQQAKGMFPMYADQIDKGMTSTALLDPYKNVLEQELNVANVDMSDPKYLGKLTQVDPKTGTRTMPNLDQWRTQIRTDPTYGWQNTTGAQNLVADMGDRLVQELGAKR